MATQDNCCTIVPYFKVHEGQLQNFKALCEEFVKVTETEPNCLYYGFSFDGDQAHCREGYANAEAALNHLENVAQLLEQALEISDILRLEIHGSESQLSKLRKPLEHLRPQYFTLEYGFRR
jgi:quinol monooxygenase YgiN